MECLDALAIFKAYPNVVTVDDGEGCKDKDGKLQPMKCLGGISLGDTCPSNKEDYTCSESNIPFGEDRGIYGASCNCILDVDCTCHDAN